MLMFPWKFWEWVLIAWNEHRHALFTLCICFSPPTALRGCLSVAVLVSVQDGRLLGEIPIHRHCRFLSVPAKADEASHREKTTQALPRQAVPASKAGPLPYYKGARRALFRFAQHACGRGAQRIETRKPPQALAKSGTRYFSLRFCPDLAISGPG